MSRDQAPFILRINFSTFVNIRPSNTALAANHQEQFPAVAISLNV